VLRPCGSGRLVLLRCRAVLRKNVHGTMALYGVAAMMTVADCRKRAHDCMVAAGLASDRDGQLQWQELSNDWLAFAELFGRGKSSDNETPVAAAGPVTSITDANRARVIKGGERLRARLALGDVNEAMLPANAPKVKRWMTHWRT
jgi:hypothetical protein